MKILFYNTVHFEPIYFAITQELIKTHIANGDEVHLLDCNSSIPICEINFFKTINNCVDCISRKNNAWDLLNIPEEQRHKLEVGNHLINMDFPEFASVDELKNFKKNRVDVGSAVASYLISSFQEPKPDVKKKLKELVNKGLLTSISIYETVHNFLKNFKPDIFYIFNGRAFTLRPPLRAAQDLRIKTYVYEAGFHMYRRYFFTENTYPHDLEYVKEEIKAHYQNYQGHDKLLIAKNHYSDRRNNGLYIKKLKRAKLPDNFDKSKKNIAIYISSEDEYESIDKWTETIYKNQCEGISLILNSIPETEFHFYVRVHPKLSGVDNSQTKALYSLCFPNLTFIYPDDGIDSYSLMEACEKVITFGSTMGIESSFWGKPSILLGRSTYEELGSCYIAKSHEEAVYLIKQEGLKPLPIKGAIKYGYWENTRGIPYIHFNPYNPIFLNKLADSEITDKQKLSEIIKDVIKRNFNYPEFFTRCLINDKPKVLIIPENGELTPLKGPLILSTELEILDNSYDFIVIKHQISQSLLNKFVQLDKILIFDIIKSEKTDIEQIAKDYKLEIWYKTEFNYTSLMILAKNSPKKQLKDRLKPLLSICLSSYNEVNLLFSLTEWHKSENIHKELLEIIIIEKRALPQTHDFSKYPIPVRYYNISEGDFNKPYNLTINNSSADHILFINEEHLPGINLAEKYVNFNADNENNVISVKEIIQDKIVKTKFFKTIVDSKLINEKLSIESYQVYHLNSAYLPNNVSMPKTLINEFFELSFLLKEAIENSDGKDKSFKYKQLFKTLVLKDDAIVYNNHNYSPDEFVKIVEFRGILSSFEITKTPEVKEVYFGKEIELSDIYKKNFLLDSFKHIARFYNFENNLQELNYIMSSLLCNSACYKGISKGLSYFHGYEIKLDYRLQDSPLISIIITVSIPDESIINSIKSVLKQSYTNWELIIIDFSLNNELKQKIEHYTKKDGRIKIFITSEINDKAAKNKAISIANGKFINFLNIGFILFPYSLEIFARNISLISNNTKMIYGYIVKQDNVKWLKVSAGLSSAVVEKEALEKIVDFNMLSDINPEVELWKSLNDKYEIKKLNEKLPGTTELIIPVPIATFSGSNH